MEGVFLKRVQGFLAKCTDFSCKVDEVFLQSGRGSLAKWTGFSCVTCKSKVNSKFGPCTWSLTTTTKTTATKTTTTTTTTFLGCDSIEINLLGLVNCKWSGQTQNFPWVFVSTSTDLLISSDSMSLGLTNKSTSIHENLTWHPLSFCNKSAQKNSSIL